MDNRPFFVLGDLLANLAIGLIVGLISWLIVDPGWNMWLAMFAMMAVGMVCAIIFWIPVSLRLGAMEAMVPIMFSGMLSGMVVGMWGAMTDLTVGQAVYLGVTCGLAGILFIWIYNNALRGVTRQSRRV